MNVHVLTSIDTVRVSVLLHNSSTDWVLPFVVNPSAPTLRPYPSACETRMPRECLAISEAPVPERTTARGVTRELRPNFGIFDTVQGAVTVNLFLPPGSPVTSDCLHQSRRGT